MQLAGAELVGEHRGTAGVLLQGVEHILLLVDGNELLVGLVVHVRLAGHPHVDVGASLFGFGVILVDGVLRVETGIGHVVVVDHTSGDGRVLQGGGHLFGLERGDLDLALGFVDVGRGGEGGPVALERHETGGLEHADSAGLVGFVVRNGDGVALLQVLDVLDLGGVHAERVDGGAADGLQVLLVAHVVVGQVEQVLEFVEVQLAGVKGRVFGGVVLEVDDVDVYAGLLGVLLELDPFGVGSADHADLDRVALAALGGRLVGTGKRAVAEERGHGDNRHDHDGDDDVAGGVVHTHRLVIVRSGRGCRLGCCCHWISSLQN